MTADGFRTTQLDQVAARIAAAFLVEPPGWTRLEPQSVSGDPTPGLEARVFDPLWLLTRQWQLGEFAGEDVGSPVHLDVGITQEPIGAFRPGDPGAPLPPDGPPARLWRDREFLEPVVEQDRTGVARIGLRERGDGGAQLLTELGELGVSSAALTAMLTDCRLDMPWDDPFDTAASGVLAALAGRIPDPEQVAVQMQLDGVPTLAWFAAEPDGAAVLAAVTDWYQWYRSSTGPGAGAGVDSWIDDRLEYRFSVATAGSGGGSQRVLRAGEFGGGQVDWFSVDQDAAAGAVLDIGAPLPPPTSRVATVLATPLHFAGMPAQRYWEFEDAAVNFGALQVQPHDLARLALVEFAVSYGNDWLVVPLDVPVGSYVTVDQVTVTTTFGETVTVPAAQDSARSGYFRMFATSLTGTADTAPGLFVPPSPPGRLDGGPVEEVLFLRDEIANLGWAVERTVEAPSGSPRNRTDEPRPAPFQPSTDAGADLDYQLQNDVPEWWIPFVPTSTGYGTVALRKGAMQNADGPVLPLGSILVPGRPLTVQDEEIPREGLRVRRVPALARRSDGSYVRWVTRRVTVGRGEGSSGLAFDSAIKRAPAGG